MHNCCIQCNTGYKYNYSSYSITTRTSTTFSFCLTGLFVTDYSITTFISYYMFYTLHVVEPLRYDSVFIKETNE